MSITMLDTQKNISLGIVSTQPFVEKKLRNIVKLGYNDHGYNKFTAITKD
jgi:hypothetical protein